MWSTEIIRQVLLDVKENQDWDYVYPPSRRRIPRYDRGAITIEIVRARHY
jgi:hypothetical protein